MNISKKGITVLLARWHFIDLEYVIRSVIMLQFGWSPFRIYKFDDHETF